MNMFYHNFVSSIYAIYSFYFVMHNVNIFLVGAACCEDHEDFYRNAIRLNLGDKTLTNELDQIIAVYFTMEGSTTMLYFLFLFCVCIFILYFVLHNVNIFMVGAE